MKFLFRISTKMSYAFAFRFDTNFKIFDESVRHGLIKGTPFFFLNTYYYLNTLLSKPIGGNYFGFVIHCREKFSNSKNILTRQFLTETCDVGKRFLVLQSHYIQVTSLCLIPYTFINVHLHHTFLHFLLSS